MAKKKIKIRKKKFPSILDLYNLGVTTRIESIHTDAEGTEIVFEESPTEQEKKILEKVYSQGIIEIEEGE